ncbi:MAG: hypothetical protein DMG17_19045 [Acidobacteria bacterium]|nr:MAG: hypothetical protein DMG17_19045 [Acidobacteriota bacterium]
MLGTFGGALEARKIDASDGRLMADVRGEIESEEGVLVIRRIHIAFTLRAPHEMRETVERVHGLFPNKCPLFRTLHNAIEITSSYTIEGNSESEA